MLDHHLELPPDPRCAGWVHEDDIPDITSCKGWALDIMDALYRTGDFNQMQTAVEELCCCLDLDYEPQQIVLMERRNGKRNQEL